jgi:hypothetical protein
VVREIGIDVSDEPAAFVFWKFELAASSESVSFPQTKLF